MPRKPPKYGVTNSHLIPALEKSLTAGNMTDELACLLMKLAKNLARQDKFNGYSFADEMVGDAVEIMLRKWSNFDLNKSKNPFSYFYSVIKFSFLETIRLHKLERDAVAGLRREECPELGETWEEQASREYEDGLEEQDLRIGPNGYIIPIDMPDDVAKDRYGIWRGTKTQFTARKAKEHKNGKDKSKGSKRKRVKPG